MKKYLFLASVAALSFTACTNETEEFVGTGSAKQQQEIAFFPLNQKSTRAAGAEEWNSVEGTGYPQNYEMKVVAYSVVDDTHKGNYFGSATANTAPLFAYQHAAGEGGASHVYWGGKTSTDTQYWPLSPATLNFLAVSNNGSPDADMVSETFQSDYASGVDITLGDNKPQAAHSDATTGQHDLMYAFGRAAVTQDGGRLVIPPFVGMTFEHALSWVVFRVKAGNLASQAISIKDIKLNDAYYGGAFQARVNNYNSNSTALAWDAENTKWTSATNDGDYYSPNFSSQYNTRGASGSGANDSKSLINGTYFNVGDGLLVVPTSGLTPAKNSIGSFEIEYYLNGNLYTYSYEPVVKVFEKGKKYVYDITMTLHEIFVDASVTDWQDGGTEIVDIPSVAVGENKAISIPATAGKYTFQITGLTADPTCTYDTGAASFPATPTKNYSAGVATFTFNVTANESGSDKEYKIVVNNADPAKSSTITITQAH